MCVLCVSCVYSRFYSLCQPLPSNKIRLEVKIQSNLLYNTHKKTPKSGLIREGPGLIIKKVNLHGSYTTLACFGKMGSIVDEVSYGGSHKIRFAVPYVWTENI